MLNPSLANPSHTNTNGPHQAVQSVHYLQLGLMEFNQLPILPILLERYSTEAYPAGTPPLTDQEMAICHLKTAYQHLKTLQRQHSLLRQTYLEDLAKAKVIYSSPHLLTDSMATA
jgi:hypothetical protein